MAVAGLVTGLLTAAVASPAHADPGASGHDHGDAVTITLITGDRVTVRADADDATPHIRPGEGREHIMFSVGRKGDGFYIVPSDAAPLIADGILDRRLFDVTALTGFGYHDAARDDIPLILGTVDTNVTATAGTHVRQRLDALDMIATEQPKDSAADFWETVTGDRPGTLATGVTEIRLDGKRRLLTDTSVDQIGAPEAWAAGYTGEGVTVGVLDSGVDTSHPDLVDRIAEARDFTGGDDPVDRHGHGTHVASIIAGTGAASDGRYTGVAPGAELLTGKVCDADGYCRDSDIIAGMEWAAQQGAAAVNLSLGWDDFPEIDPVEQAVADLTARYGTLFVIAAGNSGADRSVTSPGSATAALTVGAVDAEEALAEFSSRGPRVGDHAAKPDVTAPGVDITAARAAGTAMGTPVDDHYTTDSGTSMATPHVAGAVALLAQQHPEWTPAQLKGVLMGTASPNPELGAHEQGAGRVDSAAALSGRLHADPAGVSAGMVQWPHETGETIPVPVTYHNPTGDEVTLDLALPGGGGLFGLAADSVTVPAGGKATVEVRVTPAATDATGFLSTRLVATAEGVTITTPVHLTKEVESYDLTVRFRDGHGEPAEADVMLLPLDGDARSVGDYVSGEWSLRLTAGDYHLTGVVLTPRSDGADPALSMHSDPRLELTEDTTIVMDAARAAPVSMTAPRNGLTPQLTSVMTGRPGARFSTHGMWGSVFDGMATENLGDGTDPGVLTTVAAGWTGAAATDATWQAVVPVTGLPTGYRRDLLDADFAKIRSTYRAQGVDAEGYKSWIAQTDLGSDIVFHVPVGMPSTRNEFVFVAEEVEWGVEFGQFSTGTEEEIEYNEFDWHAGDYRPGETYRESWNTAMFGPSTHPDATHTERVGDELIVFTSMLSGHTARDGSDAMHTSGWTRLFRDDALVFEGDYAGHVRLAGLPAETADYRMVTKLSRDGGVSPFSTSILAEWAFTSAADAVSPLLSVRFAPRGLDMYNHVPANDRVRVPLSVVDSTGAIRDDAVVSVEVSFDGGATWETGTVRDGRLILDTPEGTGTVSLRATASTGDGSVTQTVIDAFGYR
ncbi:S8 family serine peptidase [Stackebrandtia albiflava]